MAEPIEHGMTTIIGNNFSDSDGNGQRGTSLIKGDNPDIVLVLDVSGSTLDEFIGETTIADQNSDNRDNTIIDAELAAAKALHSFLIEGGYGQSNLGLVAFDDESATYYNGRADNSDEDEYSFLQQLNQISGYGSTNFTAGLSMAQSLLEEWGGKERNIIFISDGYPNLGDGVAVANDLRESGTNIQAFGTGLGASKQALDNLDDNGIAYIFYGPDELIQVLSGQLSEDVQENEALVYTEDGLAGKQVFLDLNGNGKLDDNEPNTITDQYGNYSLDTDGIPKGSYSLNYFVDKKTGYGSMPINLSPDKENMVQDLATPTTPTTPTKQSIRKIKSFKGYKRITENSGKIIKGSEADEVIHGNHLPNKLKGKQGSDFFLIKGKNIFGKQCDQIIDFNSLENDQIVLHRKSFKDLTNQPSFAKAMSNKELKSLAKTDTTIIYNQTSAKLFYNSNGDEKGLGSIGLFARVAGSPDLDATDLGWI